MDTLRERLARNCPRTSPDKADHVLCIPGDSPCIACEAAAALDAHVCSCCAEREADWRAKREAQWKRENPMGSTLIETEPQKPTEHTLTLQFGRFLSRAEWREVAEQAWKLPHVQGLRADAVAALSAPAPAENANRLATFDDLPLAGHIERDGHPRAVVFVADVRAALSAPAGDTGKVTSGLDDLPRCPWCRSADVTRLPLFLGYGDSWTCDQCEKRFTKPWVASLDGDDCNCWLGTSATWGSSTAREACPVHGINGSHPVDVASAPAGDATLSCQHQLTPDRFIDGKFACGLCGGAFKLSIVPFEDAWTCPDCSRLKGDGHDDLCKFTPLVSAQPASKDTP